MSYLYCIQCGHMDEVHQGTHHKEVIHGIDEQHLWLEWQECNGPFAFNVPPVSMDDFITDFTGILEPDANELAVMNENALLLLADLEL